MLKWIVYGQFYRLAKRAANKSLSAKAL